MAAIAATWLEQRQAAVVTTNQRRTPMRSILLFLLGVPIPIIILIALFVH